MANCHSLSKKAEINSWLFVLAHFQHPFFSYFISRLWCRYGNREQSTFYVISLAILVFMTFGCSHIFSFIQTCASLSFTHTNRWFCRKGKENDQPERAKERESEREWVTFSYTICTRCESKSKLCCNTHTHTRTHALDTDEEKGYEKRVCRAFAISKLLSILLAFFCIWNDFTFRYVRVFFAVFFKSCIGELGHLLPMVNLIEVRVFGRVPKNINTLQRPKATFVFKIVLIIQSLKFKSPSQNSCAIFLWQHSPFSSFKAKVLWWSYFEMRQTLECWPCTGGALPLPKPVTYQLCPSTVPCVGKSSTNFPYFSRRSLFSWFSQCSCFVQFRQCSRFSLIFLSRRHSQSEWTNLVEENKKSHSIFSILIPFPRTPFSSTSFPSRSRANMPSIFGLRWHWKAWKNLQ